MRIPICREVMVISSFLECLPNTFDNQKLRNHHSTLHYSFSSLKLYDSRTQDLQMCRRSIYFAMVLVTDKPRFSKNGVSGKDDELFSVRHLTPHAFF